MPKNNSLQKIVNVKLGKNTKIYDFVNLYECEIGDNTKIGSFVEIQKGVKIGKNCKISSHSFLCEGVEVADGVFIGHHVVFINDNFPRATDKKGKLKTKKDWKIKKTLVEKNSSIGSGAIIMGGVTIGKESLVGAGAVVVENVQKKAIVVGNPARLIKYIK